MKHYKKIIMSLCAAALLIAVSVGATLAYFSDKDSKKNVITMGHVSGTLTETGEKVREDKSSGLDFDNIKPGDILAKDPTVKLEEKSLPAYVRMKISYMNLDETKAAELEKNLDIQDGWKKSGEYYYYDKPLSYDKDNTESYESTLFKNVTIPKGWGNEIAEQTFEMNISAEFIQADGITVSKDDNGMITGWGDVTITAYPYQK